MPLLFAYGTLQDRAVQLALFERPIAGEPGELTGFERSTIELTDPEETSSVRSASYPIVHRTGHSDSRVRGTVLVLTDTELAIADAYEPFPYQRVAARLQSGKDVWVYADARPTSSSRPPDSWGSGDAYDPFMGRWSRLVAREFIAWLGVRREARWTDVGCGTGALTEAILRAAAPARVTAIDASAAYVATARRRADDGRAVFAVGDARALPLPDATSDVAVSGLMLNFVPQPERAVAELARVVGDGGTAAAYVWDYAEGMQLLRRFWDAAVALDPGASALDEGRRFPICSPAALQSHFHGAGLRDVETRAIEVPMRFRDFDDYWRPFLGGQGPAPGYVVSLSEPGRARLRVRLQRDLPVAPDGSITLMARAWAVRSRR